MNGAKICFATEATYPNYINRVKQNILGDYLKYEVYKHNIPYIITTNRPHDFDEFASIPSIKVYSIDEIRQGDTDTFKYEVYPEDPTGLYPGKYPWNVRRFTLKKAAELGYNSCYYFEADMRVNYHLNMTTQEFINTLYDVYVPNTLTTNTGIFRYRNKTPFDVFCYHEQYIKKYNFNFLPEQYDTVDGTLQFYMGQTPEDLMNFYENWNNLALFGYKNSVNGDYGYKNNAHGVLSFVIPLSRFTLREISLPFFPDHHFNERY